MKKLFLALTGLILVLAIVVAGKTWLSPSLQGERPVAEGDLPGDEMAYAGRLADFLRLATVSTRDPRNADPKPFAAFHGLLEEHYPLVHQHLDKKTFNGFSILYHWRGRKKDLKPVLLLAHMDVVPAGGTDLSRWPAPPFAGVIKDGQIHGRGALDDKGSLIAIMEAAEALLEKGFVPSRDIYFAFGHDEEVGGARGAAAIAAHLLEKGVMASFTLDEGAAVISPKMSPAGVETALIGLAEKGYLTLEITVTHKGGHSSMPIAPTTLDILAEAITRLRDNPFPVNKQGPFFTFQEYAAPEMSGIRRVLFSNGWLFDPLIEEIMNGIAPGFIRTTMVPTMIEAGVKENVIPSTAKITVNLRLLPGDSVKSVIARLEEVLDGLPVTVRAKHTGRDASRISDVNGEGYHLVHRAIGSTFPADTVIAPFLTLAGTDSRHYELVSENSYRFSPFRLGDGDLATIHGIGEKIPVADYVRMIRFYKSLIKNLEGEKPLTSH